VYRGAWRVQRRNRTWPAALCAAGPSSFRATRHAPRSTLIFTLLVVLACSADAQPGRRSQRGTVTQSVNGTDIAITYYRPVLRGRTPFPGIVNWWRLWTPGADSATRLETSREIEVEGSKLAAGKYSLWLIPAENDAWTVIFNRAHSVFHLAYDESQDALRVQARPTTGAPMETLGFYFPLVDADSAVLDVHWGTTVLPIRIRAR